MPIQDTPDASVLVPSSVPLDKSTPIHIGLGFRGFNKKAADEFFATLMDPDSPNFRAWVPTHEFGLRFGPSDEDIEVVNKYLSSNGFTNIKVARSRLFISADGTFAIAEKAFHTTIANFVRPAELVAKGEPLTFYAPISPPTLPADVASAVTGVNGLCNLAIQHPANTLSIAPAPAQAGSGYLPSQFITAYNSLPLHNARVTGQGMKIAIHSPTQYFKDDPKIFAQDLNLPPPTIYEVLVDGGPTDNGGALEAALDLETIDGQAPNSTIIAFEPPNSNQGELDSFDAVANFGITPILSSSWGDEETALIQSHQQAFATSFENVCQALASSGVSIFVASGDSGAFSRSGSSTVTTTMESSCPFVTSVGGTALFLNSNNTWKSETAWQYVPSTNQGGGGGLSQLFARPSWQTGPGVLNSFSNGKRQVPDVAGDASDQTPYEIIFNGGATPVLGTSAATPLWAANVLLMEQEYGIQLRQKVPLGLINPGLYWLGQQFENPAIDFSGSFYVYHDITVGDDGKYSSTPTWDFCTGWGSADFTKLLDDLGDFYAISPYSPDFVPYNPHPSIPAWTSPLMIHISKTSVTEPPSFVHGQTYWIGVAGANLGTSDGPTCSILVKVDNNTVSSSMSFNCLPVNTFTHTDNLFSTTFTAGTHTLTFTVNSGSSVRELNRSNNTFTRTITVH